MPDNPAPALEMRGIGKRFPGVVALHQVSFAVAPGEVVALIGENGAGKSTLMKILGGVYAPDTGAIFIDGVETRISSVSDAIGCRISFIHQELNVLDNLDVASNVFLGREPLTGGPLRLIDRKRLHQQARTYLDRLGVNVSTSTPLSALSIAEQQMVEIAKALSLQARILIMDEPTSSLTLTETDRLLRVVLELKAQGVSIIYISHRLGEIHRIADRVVALRDGEIAGELQREEIEHDRMVRLMVGRDLESYYVKPSAAERRIGVHVHELRTRRYPNRSVSFDLREGEILGFAGLVGAGRTEVARALFGVEPAAGGTVEMDGRVVSPLRSSQQSISLGIYLIPEDRRLTGLIVEMPIRENVTLPSLERFARFSLVDRKRERRSAAETCSELGVRAPSVEVLASSLSGGNQQKVVLAKWLRRGPRVLIFDEPTRGIDVGAKAEIYRLMRSLADGGVAIMMVSSDMEEVLGVSDRIAVMHEGEISGFLEREQFSEDAVMRLAVGAARSTGAAAA